MMHGTTNIKFLLLVCTARMLSWKSPQ